jgi:hypothetical protein
MDYKQVRKICQENSNFTKRVLDEFLLYYAADRGNLSKEADRRMATYKHILGMIDQSWHNMLKSQYIMHRVMKKGGLIQKYLNHAAIKNMAPADREWLAKQAVVPWKFSFSIVIENPEKDFFLMQDVYSGVEFLLHSPTITEMLKTSTYSLWFNLISYNGTCWQTYGPLAGYKSFDADDIFFFATEVNQDIEDEEDLIEEVENNPVPYMMIYAYSDHPLTIHEDHVIQTTISEIEDVELHIEGLESDFEMETAKGVLRLQLKGWWDFPHFAVAYFDQKFQFLQATAMTLSGFEALAGALKKYGVSISSDPDILVKPSMMTAAESILKKEIELMNMELLFEDERSSPEQEASLDSLNLLLGKAIPMLNAGQEPDLEAISKEVGIDWETYKDTIEEVIGNIKSKKGKSR